MFRNTQRQEKDKTEVVTKLEDAVTAHAVVVKSQARTRVSAEPIVHVVATKNTDGLSEAQKRMEGSLRKVMDSHIEGLPPVFVSPPLGCMKARCVQVYTKLSDMRPTNQFLRGLVIPLYSYSRLLWSLIGKFSAIVVNGSLTTDNEALRSFLLKDMLTLAHLCQPTANYWARDQILLASHWTETFTKEKASFFQDVDAYC